MKNQTSFKPGQTGNAGGRPRAQRSVMTLARQHAPAMVKILAGIARDEKEKAPARVSAASAVLDRAVGKPGASLDLRFDADLLGKKLGEMNEAELLAFENKLIAMGADETDGQPDMFAGSDHGPH
jgi:hypothetical protein